MAGKKEEQKVMSFGNDTDIKGPEEEDKDDDSIEERDEDNITELFSVSKQEAEDFIEEDEVERSTGTFGLNNNLDKHLKGEIPSSSKNRQI